jgi:hypothetical protein
MGWNLTPDLEVGEILIKVETKPGEAPAIGKELLNFFKEYGGKVNNVEVDNYGNYVEIKANAQQTRSTFWEAFMFIFSNMDDKIEHGLAVGGNQTMNEEFYLAGVIMEKRITARYTAYFVSDVLSSYKISDVDSNVPPDYPHTEITESKFPLIHQLITQFTGSKASTIIAEKGKLYYCVAL